ncbi:ACT domain-containing protein [Mycotypha africana]|uniref:ACT domain-containing protein n=1 Tax=Mycotypha africana TaxID=64632 RepID=UPI002301025F|nr:ACT domain-containing protein [Mycotypha africana]KAI8975505.1 ACT domain-containing protein [Mycotypha africana]
MSVINLKYLPDDFSIYQFERTCNLPATIFKAPWYTVSRTTTELSVILPTNHSMKQQKDEIKNEEHGWRMFQVDAQMEFTLVGILASIVGPLKENNIPVFVVSTYDTDYIMVKKEKLALAIETLNKKSNIIVSDGRSVYDC